MPKYTWMNAVNVSGKALSQARSQARPAKHNREQVEEFKNTRALTHSLPGLHKHRVYFWVVTGESVKCQFKQLICGKNVFWLEQPQNHEAYVICNRNPSLMPTVLLSKCELLLPPLLLHFVFFLFIPLFGFTLAVNRTSCLTGNIYRLRVC